MRPRREHAEAPELPRNERVAPPEPLAAPSDVRGRLGRFARRALVFCSRALLILGVVVGAAYLGGALEGFVRTSPAFAVAEIRVSGRSHLEEAEVIAASGLSLGDNIFKSPPEEVEERLRAHPWIERASVRRKLPKGFEVEIVEHRPRALLALPELYLVSDRGVVFKEASPEEAFDLPIITLEDEASIRASRERRTALLEEVAALLFDVDAIEPSWSEALSEIHVHGDGAFTLGFGDEGVEVRLGRGEAPQKLERIHRVFQKLEAVGASATRIHADNERHPDRVIVELRGARRERL